MMRREIKRAARGPSSPKPRHDAQSVEKIDAAAGNGLTGLGGPMRNGFAWVMSGETPYAACCAGSAAFA